MGVLLMPGCLLCEDGCKWCRPSEVWPEWFRPSRYAKTQAHHVRRGRHPMGDALLGEAGKTCGNCAHHIMVRFSRVYHGCDLRQSGGPATDVRLAWPACAKWEGE